MAQTGMDKLKESLSQDYELETERRIRLLNMKDGLEKQWIEELLARVESLEEEIKRG